MYTNKRTLCGLFYFSTFLPISISSDLPLPPLPPGIPLNQFTKILFSEIDNELQFKSLDPSTKNFQTANQHYNAATKHAWTRAFDDYVDPETLDGFTGETQLRRHLQEEEQEEEVLPLRKGLVIPFLICLNTPDSSGYERRRLLLSELEPSKESTSGIETIPLTPIYNRMDQTCFRTSLPAHRASLLNALGIQVQPLLYAMKLTKDSIELLRTQTLVQEIDGEMVTKNPVLDVEWCNQISPPSNTPKESVIKSDLIDFMSKMMNAPTSLYWSSLTTEANEEGLTITEEGQYWLDTLSSSNNERCPLFYDRMEIQFMSPPNIPTSEPTIPKLYPFTISFPNNIGPVDHDCLMALLINAALSPQVCSVQSRPSLELYGKQAQWITQSNVENHRPYFDLGLKGSRQVIGVSDTGLDMDHCYFTDSRVGSNFNKNAVRFRNVVLACLFFSL